MSSIDPPYVPFIMVSLIYVLPIGIPLAVLSWWHARRAQAWSALAAAGVSVGAAVVFGVYLLQKFPADRNLDLALGLAPLPAALAAVWALKRPSSSAQRALRLAGLLPLVVGLAAGLLIWLIQVRERAAV